MKYFKLFISCIILFGFSQGISAHDFPDDISDQSSLGKGKTQTPTELLKEYENVDNFPWVKDVPIGKKIIVMSKDFDPVYSNPAIVPPLDKISKFTEALPRFPEATKQPLPGYFLFSLAYSHDKLVYLFTTYSLPGGVTINAHRHAGYQLFFYVLSGMLVERYGDTLEHTITGVPGDLVYFPAGVCHQPLNPSATMAVKVLTIRIMDSPTAKRKLIPCAQRYQFPITKKKVSF
ncbi:MAG: hypothetical protein A3F41_05245 [Coxiella sp. RIFCSPHIGHO2_12_FULL_44_14]|nr:MAG: hypothetical protein A3F41_05245 [Coxiella sp. RIFCSPHIGHO2_12_FULL_44_14]